METIPTLFISLLLAIWMSIIALLSVQNATLVSLSFLFFQSIQLPLGIVLAVGVSLGLIVGTLLQALRNSSENSQPGRTRYEATRGRFDDPSEDADW